MAAPEIHAKYSPVPNTATYSAITAAESEAPARSGLTGRATAGASSAIHRAFQRGLTLARATLGKIASALPGTPRTGREPAEKQALIPKEVSPAGSAQSQPSGPEGLDPQLQLRQRAVEARAEILAKTSQGTDAEIDRVLATALGLARENAPTGQIARKTHDAFINADAALLTLDAQGVTHFGSQGYGAPASLFVAAGLGRLTAEERQPLLQAMRPNDLQRLVDADPTGLAAGKHSAITLAEARGEIEKRDAQLSDAFRSAAETLLSRHPAGCEMTAGIEEFVRDLHALGQAFGALKALREGIGERLTPEMAALRSRIGAHLREWASSGSVDLGSLGREQLERLVPLLRQFDASPSEEVLRKAVAAPLAALGAVYTAAATRTLHGILNEDPHQILKGLLDMEAGYAPLRDVHSIILGDLRSSQDGLDLRRSLLANALRGLDEHDVMRAFSAARSPDSLALLDGLFEASSTVTAQGQDLVGNRLTTLGAYFEETSAQLADELDERARQTGATSMIPRDDTGRPIMPSSGERITADLLPPLARAALREVLGLESRPEGAPEFRFRNDV